MHLILWLFTQYAFYSMLELGGMDVFKIIWNKSDYEFLTKRVMESSQYTFIDDPNLLSEGKIGIVCDEENMEDIKPILEQIEFDKALMLFPTTSGWVQIPLSHILFIESFGEEIDMHLSGGRIEQIKQPLYQLEEMLANYKFARIAKSYIVNLRKIKYISLALNAKLNLELTDGSKLAVSRSYAKSFKKVLGL